MPSLKTEGNEDDIVISLSHVTKTFQTYERPRDFVKEILTGRPNHKAFKALDDISFDVRRGEIIGVIGRNGAGKSTLLRLIAGVLEPSSGEVKVKGRVSALLELGSGFHPEYTGRENVYLGGMCIGMSREEIDQKMDWIITFSELEEFIDQPFKTYSSGMQARLTFATAISVEPDILIIDEVLAVGDSLFQSKCIKRIRELSEAGCSVFCVSHGISLIAKLCNKAILIADGRVIDQGITRDIVNSYELMLFRQSDAKTLPPEEQIKLSLHPDQDAAIETVRVINDKSIPVSQLHHGKKYRIQVNATSAKDMDEVSLGISLKMPSGFLVYAKNLRSDDMLLSMNKGDQVRVNFDFYCNLSDGLYFLSAGLAKALPSGETKMLHIKNILEPIHVVGGSDKFGGIVDLSALITIDHLDDH